MKKILGAILLIPFATFVVYSTVKDPMATVIIFGCTGLIIITLCGVGLLLGDL